MILDEDANAELVELVLALANAWKQARPKADATIMCLKPIRYLDLSAKEEEASSWRVLDEMNARSGDQTMMIGFVKFGDSFSEIAIAFLACAVQL